MIRLLLAALLAAAYSQPFSFVRESHQYTPPAPHGRKLIADPYFALAADMNADEKLDLVTGTRGEPSLKVYYSGQPAEAEPAVIHLDDPPTWVQAHDVNGDKRVDLVYGRQLRTWIRFATAGGWSDAVEVKPINQREGFSSYSEAIAFSDLNSDGKVDAVWSTLHFDELYSYYLSTSITVALGRGDGTFNALPSFTSCGSQWLPLQGAQDLDGDAIPDLLSKCNRAESSEYIEFHRGDGRGGFAEGIALLGLGDGSRTPDHPILSDLNGDGRLDFVVGRRVSLANDALRFGPALELPIGWDGRAIHSADLDGDRRAEVYVAAGSYLAVCTLNQDGSFASTKYFVAGVAADEAVFLDLNADGWSDVVLFNRQDSAMTLLTGEGYGTFSDGIAVARNVVFSLTVSGAFSRSGRREAAAFDLQRRSVLLFSPAFPGGREIAAGLEHLGSVREVITADMNNDGLDDIVASASGGFLILYSNGDSSFRSAFVATSASPRALTTADFNADGLADLIYSQQDLSLRLLTGSANGGFAAERSVPVTQAVPIPSGYYPGGLRSGDFNGDGAPDVLILHYSGADGLLLLRTLLLRRDDGTFSMFPGNGVGGSDASVVDYNGDGRPDLVISGDDVLVYRGIGTGHFIQVHSLLFGECFCRVAIADFNRDSQPDMAVLDNRRRLNFFKNQGSFGYAGEMTVPEHGQLVVMDWDDDGRLDLVVITRGGTLYAFLNRN